MKNLFKMLFKRDKHVQNYEIGFPITTGMPLPIRTMDYNDQLRIVRTLKNLPVGGSFPVKSNLTEAVRKMTKEQFPEYKISIRNFGTSHRVFRVA